MSHDGDNLSEIDQAIDRVVRRFRGLVDPTVLAERLRHTADELTATPEHAGVSFDDVTGTLHVVFERPNELEERLSEFVDLRALVVDAPVPMHQDVVVRVSGNGRAIEMMGRVVQELPNGRCVQLDRLDPVTETRLRALPDAMREPAPHTGNFDRPHTGKRPAFQTPVPQTHQPSTANHGFERAPTLASYRPTSGPSRTWDLTENDISEPLLKLVANNATGLLEVVKGPGLGRLMVLIDRGAFVDIGSDPESPDEALEALLVRSKLLTAEDRDNVGRYRETYGVGSSEALLNLGVIDINELQIGLRTRIRYLLRNLWDLSGDVRFHPLEELPAKTLARPVQILPWVFGELVERCDGELPPGIDGHLFRPPDTLPPVLATVNTLPQHDDVLGIRFGTGKSAREILRLSRSNTAETIVAIDTLVRLGFLERTAFRPISRVQTQSVKQLDMLHARLSTTSHFEVFGLHWSAYDEEVEQRYASLTKKFDPAQFVEVKSEDVLERLEQVRARIDDAWRVLRNAKRRREHREQVVDSFKVESSIEMFEQQADTATFRRDLGEAIAFYSRILELQPERLEIREKIRQLKELE
jgi:hypothetical protein